MTAAGRSAVVCLGESMIRLAAPDGVALESAAALDLHVAGCESNVAVALVALGGRARWVSALPANPLGRWAEGQIRRGGVDTSGVRWIEKGRMGLYFTESGAGEWTRLVVYDRAGSAFARCAPDDLDWSILDGARLLHLSGITPALAPEGPAIFRRARAEAAARDVRVSVDVNYRSSLWTREEAGAFLEHNLSDAEIIFCSGRDLSVLSESRADAEGAARSVRRRFGCDVVVVTLGSDGAVALCEDGVHRAPAFELATVDRIGRGDAFAGGFLFGWLEGRGPNRALRLGCAAAALAQAYRGDVVWGTAERYEALARGEGPGPDR